MLARLLHLGALSGVDLVPPVANAQATAASIVGVWKVVSVETKETGTGKIVRPFGERPTGTFVFTRGGRMAGMQFASNRKPASGPNATEPERAALFSTMTAYSGTYHVEGKRLIISVEDSSVQSWNGSKRTLDIDLNGRRLTGTSEPFKSLITGLDVVGIVTREKAECPARQAGRRGLETWWAVTGSNRRHPACKAGALPAELTALPPPV